MNPELESIGEFDLHAYADGQLDGARAERVERWLAAHPDDAARVRGWREQNRLIQAIHDAVPDKPFDWSGRGPSLGRGQHLGRGMVAMGGRRTWRAAAAAVALFVAGGAAGWFGNDLLGARGAETAQVAEAAISAHRLYTAENRHPVEVRATEAHLLGWLSRRLGHELVAPDLKAQGYWLVGGRLLPGANGAAAQLMYEDRGGRRLTLYAVRSGKTGESAFRFAESQGTRAIYWMDGPVAYALIGDLDRATLLTITRMVQTQVEK